ncbi:MAG: branched-chain amino acid ABC transporter [Haliea sp.]|nr:MAG: branched-chain amino acid ABC transporter [Haliea sp.]
MAVDDPFLLALAGMAVASYACRIGGHLLMGYVRITPRVEAALKAIPLAVMIGIVTPAATAGKLPELAGLAAVAIAMKLTGKDVVAVLAGVAAVGLCRWYLPG